MRREKGGRKVRERRGERRKRREMAGVEEDAGERTEGVKQHKDVEEKHRICVLTLCHLCYIRMRTTHTHL